MQSAKEIAEQYAVDGEVLELEQAILRHMEHHMCRAVVGERNRCAKIANNDLVDGLSAEEAAGAIREAILDPSNP